jgi:RNA polymerase sigma-70 factor (ECF subfamily)
LAAILLEHHDVVLTFLRRKLASCPIRGLDAEDLLQQVYVEAFQSIGNFDPRSERAFRNWLESIADHRLVDAVRSATAEKRGGKERHVSVQGEVSAGSYINLLEQVAADLTTPSGVVARDEGLAMLRFQLSQLPEDQRRAVELRHLHGLSREQIATVLSRTSDEVRGLIYRGMERLRERLGSISQYLSRRS